MKQIFIIILIALTAGNTTAAKRIVSLAPSLTKIIYSLDAKTNLVGCTSYCETEKSLNTAVVASMVQINTEKIFLLRPDIVLATSITKPSEIEALRRLGLKVTVFNTPKSFSEICSQFFEIATLIGKKEKADQILAIHKAKVEHLSKLVNRRSKPRIFFQIGANPLFTVIPNTFMNDYITFAGGVNIASGFPQGTITRESVVMRNPDVIFIVTMGIVGPEEKLIWEGYPNITAVKNKKIFIIESEKACVATPQNFSEVLELLIQLIY